MVEAALERCPTLGVADKRVFYDKFTTTGETATPARRAADLPIRHAGYDLTQCR